MENIAGRKDEIALLESLKTAQQSAFVAVYGRRRVGKTYLIRTVFENQFCFHNPHNLCFIYLILTQIFLKWLLKSMIIRKPKVNK